MRRMFWSVAAVLGLAVSATQAQYLVIRVYVGGEMDSGSSGTAGRGAGGGEFAGGGGEFAGGGGAGFAPGAAGAGGRPGGGAGFAPGAAGMGGPGQPGPGLGGGFGPGGEGRGGAGFAPGAAGIGGPGRPGGGAGFAPGAAGMGGPGRPGAPNMPGMGGPMGGYNRGGMSAPGMMMGGAAPGAAGGMGMGGAAGGVIVDAYESYVIVAVELLDKNPIANDNLNLRQYRHIWGNTAIFNDNTTIITNIIDQKSPRRRLQDLRNQINRKPAKDRSAADFVTMAEFALKHGMVNDCMAILDEVIKSPPANVDEKTQERLNVYKKVREALAQRPMGNTFVAEWKRRLPNFVSAESKAGHYVIFYNDQSSSTPPDIVRRLDLLENNYNAFFVWFALQGVALKVPQEKLVAVMVPDPTTFRLQRTVLGASQSVADSFLAARDNVAIFSSQRLDEAYQIFAKVMQDTVWKQFPSREALLTGREAPQELRRRRDWKNDFSRAQTLALVDKALEHEAEVAAVTHEGTKQLAIATELMPANLVAPQWISFGFASLFDTPKGPYAGANGTGKVAMWPVYGAPNWAYIRPFRLWANSKDPLTKLDEPAVALRRTVTDHYFVSARKTVDEEIDPNATESERQRREKEIQRAKEELLRARCQAWALTYYLAQHRMPELLEYFKLLGQLPRDLELDDETMWMTFARAFKLTTPDGKGTDEGKVKTLAADWFRRIDAEVQYPDDPLPERQKPQAGNAPGRGGPGGGPAGGPGGGDGGGPSG